MKTRTNLNSIERELHRLGCLPLDSQYGYGQPLWEADEKPDGTTEISDGQESATVETASLLAGLQKLDQDDGDLFERMWEAIQFADVIA